MILKNSQVLMLMIVSVVFVIPTFQQFPSIGPQYFNITNGAATPLRNCLDVVSGGPPKDGIPSIDDPEYLTHDEFVSSFSDDYFQSLQVIGIVVNGEARAYPIDIMNWHEIVNDQIDGHAYSITYCPLTGSGIFYSTDSINESTLGTTGKLYENNLVFYDRLTDTWWGQMLNIGLCGPLAGSSLEMLPVVHASWKTWEAMYPNTFVLSRNTGHDRDYDVNPYAGYDTSGSIWFYTTYTRNMYPYNLFHPKEITHVFIRNQQPFLFPHDELKQNSIVNIPDSENLEPLVTVHDLVSGLTQTFRSRLSNGEQLLFQLHDNAGLSQGDTFGLTVFQDVNTRSIWNMKGEAIAGPLKGTILDRYPSYDAYWFSTVVHFPNALIFVNDSFIENIGGSLENITLPILDQADAVNEAFLINALGVVIISGAMIPLLLVVVQNRRRRHDE